MPPSTRPRSDGIRSRNAILDAAAKLATVVGLDGLSIGVLAEHVGISKSGLYAHFGSKEELQLATIDVAFAIYERDIVRPALAHADPVARLRAVCENFVSYVERDSFPGGCFFASTLAEFDTRKGAVHDRLLLLQSDWLRGLQDMCAAALATGRIPSQEGPDQLAFELNAALHLANDMYVLYRDPIFLTRARHSIKTRLPE
ncbi:TetR/AcrR family transcriptional regulator [Nonomuraea maritima]|uniref:TetR/AcrR family transcriptional regulator n=1 Tax=Nonomuraea maritima TaxID=683260 RepID=UPI003719935A